ncbi:Helicase, C-terminal [Trichophyton rubrum]|nr:Helicase, C-terminal [Trichophyton rubrum]
MDMNAPENNVYNEDIVFNKDFELLTPLFQSDASFAAGGNQVMGDISPVSKPTDVTDSVASSLTRASDNYVAKYSNLENGGKGEDPKNCSGDMPPSQFSDMMWVELEKELDSSELDEHSEKTKFEEAKAAFEAEMNPSLEAQIRFEKAKEKECLRLSRVQLREALIQQERNIQHGCINGNETEDVRISMAQGGENQKPGKENDFDLFYPENNAAPAEELHRCTSPSNEESIPVFVWERTQTSKESTKPKNRSRQNRVSKKVRKTNDKVKETKKRNNTPRRNSNKSIKFKKNSTNRGPTSLNFDSLFTSNIIENAKRNTKKMAIPESTSRNKKKAMREIMASIPTDDDIDMRSMSQHKKAIMNSVMKFTKRPRVDNKGGWKHINMTTSLFHYQRDRENSSAAPKGGFLCDEMGFGKTIQAIDTMRTIDGIDNYLTLLLYLRMFTSHLLLPQDVIKQILTPRFMQEIEPEIKQSSNIKEIEMFNSLQVSWFENPPKPLGRLGKEASDAGISKLFESVMDGSKGAAKIMDCIECNQRQESAFVLSCMHLCCFKCIPKLPQVGDKQITCRCGLTVTYELYLDLQKSCRSKAIRRARGSKSRCIDEFEQDKGTPTISETVLSAKLRAVKVFISKWLKESPDIKITIFTQFLGMISAISSVCEAEGWRYTTLCGKLHHRTRHANIKRFREENVSILISSLKAGGVGLDLTMASKCILVDLWWNEAIEQQAFCRLFRIGQKNDVEIVRICVENTVDDRLQLIQSRKSEHIKKAMGSTVLAQRDTLADVLTLFGVEEDDTADGGYRFLTEEEAAAQLKAKDKSSDNSADAEVEAEAEADAEVRPEPEPELEPEPEAKVEVEAGAS